MAIFTDIASTLAAAQSVLMLGSVAFAVDELPESIRLGGKQIVIQRRYAGGGVDLQTLGAFDERISWSGVLQFQNALDRAQTINTLRTAGQPVKLQISNMTVDVVVDEFRFDYLNDYRIPYTIGMHPTALLTLQGSPAAPTPTATTPVAAPAVATTPQAALTPPQLANPATKAPTYTPGTQFGAVGATPLSSILGMLVPGGAQQVTNAISQVTHLVMAGETLWSIAHAYYGDGSAWTAIAAANAILRNPNLTPGTQLIIPNPVQGPRPLLS